ncbi:hypothetical protein TRFO_32374 [Tritrichomonas foetus]|uniref:EF-hand domain-containing protein n=1 Tax=Tritrichomonas foetus TaxID=1144522 RepID=A0A1J4JR15_9EUKA|nr:hypothetical protein TRFO_32374 [Tritrichomonas foetus]|eukprot:OHT00856.1 hypothetical protein TRFO_32374 [Tritrichomonas foetus]
MSFFWSNPQDMFCKCCASLKRFEACYKQMEHMKNNEIIIREVDQVFQSNSKFDFFQFLSIINRRYQRHEYIKYIIKYFIISVNKKETSQNHPNQEFCQFLENNLLVDKETAISTLSVLKFESISTDFFFHFVFKQESSNNLIKEEQIKQLLHNFGMTNIEYILAIPSFSFTSSNYLSNCEFTNFFKMILFCHQTNDCSELIHKVFEYLDEDEKLGEITIEKINTLFSKFSCDDSTTPKISNNLIKKLFIFFQKDKNKSSLNEQEFTEFFSILCKYLNGSLNNDLYDIAYTRKDSSFDHILNPIEVEKILEDLKIVYFQIDAQKIIAEYESRLNFKNAENHTNSYFVLQNILENELKFDESLI